MAATTYGSLPSAIRRKLSRDFAVAAIDAVWPLPAALRLLYEGTRPPVRCDRLCDRYSIWFILDDATTKLLSLSAIAEADLARTLSQIDAEGACARECVCASVREWL
jgi:hypothetical protein